MSSTKVTARNPYVIVYEHLTSETPVFVIVIAAFCGVLLLILLSFLLYKVSNILNWVFVMSEILIQRFINENPDKFVITQFQLFLFQCGFFKRAKKEELEKLTREVKFTAKFLYTKTDPRCFLFFQSKNLSAEMGEELKNLNTPH